MTDRKYVLTRVKGTGGLEGTVIKDSDATGKDAFFAEIHSVVTEKLIRRDGPYEEQEEADMDLAIFMDEERRKAWGRQPKIPKPF